VLHSKQKFFKLVLTDPLLNIYIANTCDIDLEQRSPNYGL